MAEPARSPRLLSRAALRAYLGGITATELGERIAQGRIPTPIWGLKPDDRAARWDQRAVDRALDAAGALRLPWRLPRRTWTAHSASAEAA
jgi:hypothetical protein